MHSLAASLVRSPELFPLDLDRASDQVVLIRLAEPDYRQASFLDGRLAGARTARRAVAWQEVEGAVTGTQLPETAHYIFHIGHVGSTLLSRLLASQPQILPLREPAILRTLALIRSGGDATRWTEPSFASRLAIVLQLLSRSFRPEQRALVKATSFVSELAARILARPSRPKAIFMFVPPDVYLASILGAPNSPKEARLLAESRLARLHARIGEELWRLADLSEGEMVAMSWACEMTALASAARGAAGRVLWLDFEEFLRNLPDGLASAFAHLGIEISPAQLDAILSGPDLRRYAKAPEHAFDAGVRAEVLSEARAAHGSEIARGLEWLENASKGVPILKEALELARI